MKAKISKDATRVFEAIKHARTVFVFGNGGSCAIANHLETDWIKNGARHSVYVRSLCSNPSMITMVANDYGFENVCKWQLENTPLQKDDVLLVISSSGNSKNVVEAAKYMREDHTVIAFTGFDGGALKPLSAVSVHIESDDYGVIEDYHSNVMHEVVRMLK